MAATIAHAIGRDSTRIKETHRLGSQSAEASANTWRTFSRVYIERDGSGSCTINRNGVTLHYFEWGPE